MNNNDLNKAIIIATDAHSGQVDKANRPYILHPLHVMGEMRYMRPKIIAVLHDVMEDTQVTAAMLVEEGFSQDVIRPLELLTKGEGKYKDYIARLSKNWDARMVKLADLKHNLDITRLTGSLSESDLQRIKKYHEAFCFLEMVDLGG